MSELSFSRLVDVLTQNIFFGRLQSDANTIVDAVFATVPCLRDEPDARARQAFRDELLLYIQARLATQDAADIFGESQFLN